MNPVSQMAKPIRIIQITDFHLLSDPKRTMMGINTEQSFLAVLQHAWQHSDGVALYLMTGDLVQEPSIATYQRLQERLSCLSIPCYCLPGNHDDPELIRLSMVESNVHYHSQILLDGWQIICLDSTLPGNAGGYLTQNQLDLLEAGLVDQPKRYTIVCLHHSPLPTGSDWLDTMKLSNADDFFKLIKRFPLVKGVVYGHIHQTMDEQFQNLRLLGCPSTCFQFKPDCKDFALDQLPQGYRWIELHPNGDISTDVVRLDTVPLGLDVASSGY